jgi:hypothetical protein
MVAFPAFLDTCVLYPAYLCDTLLRLAEASAYRPLCQPTSSPNCVATSSAAGYHRIASTGGSTR